MLEACRKAMRGNVIKAGALVLATVAAVVAPAASTFASGGHLYAFGLNEYGELGSTTNNGTENPNPTPTLVTLPGATGPVTQVAVGILHSLAVTSTGQLYAFGYNAWGELGITANSGTNKPNPTPMLVTLPGATGPVTQVAAGAFQSLALTSSGQLYAFGDDSFGELGHTPSGNRDEPNPTPMLVTLPGATGPVTQVAAGAFHSLAVTSTGQLYAFGDNYWGELGITANSGTTNLNPTPTLVTLPGATGPVTKVAAGAWFSLAVTSSNQLYAFGENYFGQLGTTANDETENPNPTPTLVTLPGATGAITQVAAGSYQSLVATSNGQLYAFGYSGAGELGSTFTDEANPTPTLVTLPGATGPVTQLAAATLDSLVVTSTGQLYAFGYNAWGELGSTINNGTGNPNPTPTLVRLPDDAKVETVALGPEARHTLVVGAPQIVETGTASSVTRNSASLNALVFPNGEMIGDCHFQYGTTELYGSEVPCTPSPEAGESPVAVSAPLTELSPRSTYHFRVVAMSSEGTSYGSDMTFETLPDPPSVSNVRPDAGFESGGTMVTITGTELAEATAVKFGATEARMFEVNSATSITAEAPEEDEGTVNVTVTSKGGTSTTSPVDTFTYVPVGRSPTITRLSPRKGSAAGGTSVTITGTSFVGVTAVRFGSNLARSFTLTSKESIAAVSPAGTGTVEVTVTTPNGTSGISKTGRFKYKMPKR